MPDSGNRWGQRAVDSIRFHCQVDDPGVRNASRTVTSTTGRGSIHHMAISPPVGRKSRVNETGAPGTEPFVRYRHTARFDDECDVAVIGAGFAGLAAAIEASNAGASVVVLEKMHAPGGNSIISDGGVAAAGTHLQRQFSIDDSPDLMYADMVRAGLGLNHPELVREVASRSAEAFRWSTDYLGVDYLDRVDQFGGHSVPRCYTPAGVSGSSLIKRQVEKLRELGADIRVRTCLTEFILDEDGAVRGVQARGMGQPRHPEAGTGVAAAHHEGCRAGDWWLRRRHHLQEHPGSDG